MDKDKDFYHYLDLEEYFSLEDYTTYKSYNFNISSKIVNDSSVRVSFPNGKNVKEVIESKNKLKKVFAFFKIYSLDNNNNNKKNYINILVNKKEAGNYKGNNLLNKINNIKFLKGAFYSCLKIKEFPLVNKFLEEHEEDNNDHDTDKIFYLKNNNEKLCNIDQTLYNINNNNFNNNYNNNYNNNFNNYNNNYNNNFNINNNYNNFNIKMNNSLSQMNYNNNINNIQNNNQINILYLIFLLKKTLRIS